MTSDVVTKMRGRRVDVSIGELSDMLAEIADLKEAFAAKTDELYRIEDRYRESEFARRQSNDRLEDLHTTNLSYERELNQLRALAPMLKGKYVARIVDFGMNKINMIKTVRAYTNKGLKEAKDAVEGYDNILIGVNELLARSFAEAAIACSPTSIITIYEMVVEGDLDSAVPIDQYNTEHPTGHANIATPALPVP